MKKGFTLTELLVTISILAALAAIALPNFTNALNKAKAKQAVATLRAIRTAEKMFLARNGVYACQVVGSCDDATEINTVLGVEVPTTDYSFAVVAAANTTFTAGAKKGTVAPVAADCAAGAVTTDSICVNELGTWTENSAYVDSTKL